MTALTQNNCSNICTTPTMNASEATTSLFSTVLVWYDRFKSRQQLAALEPHMLEDIGISYEDAQAEAALPFWRAQ